MLVQSQSDLIVWWLGICVCVCVCVCVNGKVVHTHVPLSPNSISVPVKGAWHSAAGKVNCRHGRGKPRVWSRVLAATARGLLVHMTNVTAECVSMKPKITSPYGPSFTFTQGTLTHNKLTLITKGSLP